MRRRPLRSRTLPHSQVRLRLEHLECRSLLASNAPLLSEVTPSVAPSALATALPAPVTIAEPRAGTSIGFSNGYRVFHDPTYTPTSLRGPTFVAQQDWGAPFQLVRISAEGGQSADYAGALSPYPLTGERVLANGELYGSIDVVGIQPAHGQHTGYSITGSPSSTSASFSLTTQYDSKIRLEVDYNNSTLFNGSSYIRIEGDHGFNWWSAGPGTYEIALPANQTYELYAAGGYENLGLLPYYPSADGSIRWTVSWSLRADITLVPELVTKSLQYSRAPTRYESANPQDLDRPLPSNTPFTLEATIANVGQYAATNVFLVAFYASQDSNIDPTNDVLLGTIALANVSAGATRVATLTLNNGIDSLFSASHISYKDWHTRVHFGVVVDTQNNVREIDETNNENRGIGIDLVSTALVDPVPKPTILATGFASQRAARIWLTQNGFHAVPLITELAGDVGYYRTLPATLTFVSPYDGKKRDGRAYRQHVNIIGDPTAPGTFMIAGEGSLLLGEPDPTFALFAFITGPPRWDPLYVAAWHNRF